MKRMLFFLLAVLLLLAGCAVPEARDTTEKPASEKPTTEEPTVTENVQSTKSSAAFGCDALFFGDSITADSDFAAFFPELRIVNLGVYGDTIEDLQRRVSEVRKEDPARIFLMVGINSLGYIDVDQCLAQYSDLVSALLEDCPSARLVIESVLPVGADLERYGGIRNENVRSFNEGIKALANRRGLAYVDLYSVYEKDGALDPAQTRDGIHLNFNAYGPWAEAIRPLLTPQR